VFSLLHGRKWPNCNRLACLKFLESPSFVLLVEVVFGFGVANLRDFQPLFCFVSWRSKREIWNKQQGSPVENMPTVRLSGDNLNCLLLYRYSKEVLQAGKRALSLSCSSFHDPLGYLTRSCVSCIPTTPTFDPSDV
jgi:hypothetical protein